MGFRLSVIRREVPQVRNVTHLTLQHVYVSIYVSSNLLITNLALFNTEFGHEVMSRKTSLSTNSYKGNETNVCTFSIRYTQEDEF